MVEKEKATTRRISSKMPARRLPARVHRKQASTALAVEPLLPERALPVSLLRAREAVMVHMRPVLRAHGTTEQQWRVLRALDRTTPLDKTTLANRATLLMPSLLRILKDLERGGLVRLVKSTTNARLAGVVLTEAGGTYVEQVTAAIAHKSRILKKAIGEDYVERLLDILGEVELRLLKIDR
jgi:homoprotocatechuate degradation regulator HpaR